MPRLRLGVALLLPPPVREEVAGLQRACGDGTAPRVAPHVTLVPPVNVRAADVGGGLAVVRSAATALAGRGHALSLRLGPVATFHPATPVLHLAVGGDEREIAALHHLRDAVFAGPLERRLTWPFVPHVTLAEGIGDARIAAAVTALAGYGADVTFDRVHVLQERRDHTWVPVADAPFERPRVVGRGGIAVELVESELVDPEAAQLEPDEIVLPPGATPLVVTARIDGRVAGVAQGWQRGDERAVGSIGVAPAFTGPGAVDVERFLRDAYR